MAAGVTKGLGCLLLLAMIAWVGVELLVFYEVIRGLNRHFESAIGTGGWLVCLVWVVAMAFIGIKLAKYHISRIVAGMMNGTAGRHIIGLVGAVLLAIPGLLSDVFGILLLLPPVQRLLGRLGGALMASIVKRTMGRMMGGSGMPFPGMGAGFPGGGFPGGMFPGMKPMQPDERARFPRQPGKTYDTTIDKD